MSEPLPVAVRSGTVTLFGVEARVHVLDDGRRVIEPESVAAILRAFGEGVDITPADIEAFAILTGPHDAE